MSTAMAVLLPVLVFGVVTFVVIDCSRRMYKRRIKQLEKKNAAYELAEQMRRSVLAGLAAALGRKLVEPVRVEDIKYGDQVCWHPVDMSDHQHYVAGYDGDPGPSVDGIHARPISPEGI